MIDRHSNYHNTTLQSFPYVILEPPSDRILGHAVAAQPTSLHFHSSPINFILLPSETPRVQISIHDYKRSAFQLQQSSAQPHSLIVKNSCTYAISGFSAWHILAPKRRSRGDRRHSINAEEASHRTTTSHAKLTSHAPSDSVALFSRPSLPLKQKDP